MRRQGAFVRKMPNAESQGQSVCFLQYGLACCDSASLGDADVSELDVFPGLRSTALPSHWPRAGIGRRVAAAAVSVRGALDVVQRKRAVVRGALDVVQMMPDPSVLSVAP